MEHLIKPEWFEPMNAWLLLLIGAVATYLLVVGADWLVSGASGMALRAGMPKVIIGATIVSLGTTSPEAAVSVTAAWGGKSGLALGNAVGSVIADTGLIFGIGCLLMALPVDRFILNRQGWVQFGTAMMAAAICYGLWVASPQDATLGQWVGLACLAVLGWYLWVSVRWGRQHAGLVEKQMVEAVAPAKTVPWWRLINRFVSGLILVVLFAHIVVICVSLLAKRWGVPEVVISSTIVAMGTSLPELVVGITAVRRNHPELLIGNVIGADILNILFVMGASAAAAPLPIIDPAAAIPQIFLYLHLPTMIGILVLFRLFAFAAIRSGHFSRWMGAPLVGIYCAYLALNYVLSR